MSTFLLSDIFSLFYSSINMIEYGSSFPDDLLSYSENRFFEFVKDFVGDIEAEILRIQCIRNVRTLLHVDDVFSLFDVSCKETFALKQISCFINDDLTYIVRPGIKSNMEYFIDSLRKCYASSGTKGQSSPFTEKTMKQQRKFHVETANSMSVGMTTSDSNLSKSFLQVFIDNTIDNMNRSSNNYRHDPAVEKFASALYILGGHNAYEFIRINLPGSIPSISTLKIFNKNVNLSLKESEFRFDSLKKYLSTLDSSFVFVVSSLL